MCHELCRNLWFRVNDKMLIKYPRQQGATKRNSSSHHGEDTEHRRYKCGITNHQRVFSSQHRTRQWVTGPNYQDDRERVWVHVEQSHQLTTLNACRPSGGLFIDRYQSQPTNSIATNICSLSFSWLAENSCSSFKGKKYIFHFFYVPSSNCLVYRSFK